MFENIEGCCRLRKIPEWCQLTPTCKGWGCRHLTIIPETLPSSVHERGTIFSQVYRLAESMGVLTCPFFKESAIDSIVEDDIALASMIEERDLQI